MTSRSTRIRFDRIFHPSDFTAASDVAFGHALKIALEAKAALTILHTGETLGDCWADFPRVRGTLERWKVLPAGSSREALAGLGLDVHKVVLPEREPVHGILRYLGRHPHDLIVLGTHRQEGWRRWTHHPVAVPVARTSAEMTLFLPDRCPGFVGEDGSNRLRNILIAVDAEPAPQNAIDAAIAIGETLGGRGVRGTVLHVGETAEMPEGVFLPSTDTIEWHLLYRKGRVEEEILKAALDTHADLIVMSTAGRHGFLDALRGSTTERVVHNARCAVLAAPTYSTAEAVSMVDNLATGRLAVNF